MICSFGKVFTNKSVHGNNSEVYEHVQLLRYVDCHIGTNDNDDDKFMNQLQFNMKRREQF